MFFETDRLSSSTPIFDFKYREENSEFFLAHCNFSLTSAHRQPSPHSRLKKIRKRKNKRKTVYPFLMCVSLLFSFFSRLRQFSFQILIMFFAYLLSQRERDSVSENNCSSLSAIFSVGCFCQGSGDFDFCDISSIKTDQNNDFYDFDFSRDLILIFFWFKKVWFQPI